MLLTEELEDAADPVEIAAQILMSFERSPVGSVPDIAGADLSGLLPENVRADIERALRLPAAQQPQWPDPAQVRRVTAVLEGMAPLTVPSEIDRLSEHLEQVATGNAIFLQGGDCAETFAGNTEHHVFGNLRTLTQMAVLIGHAVGKPVVRVGRVAGQYAKPRSADLDDSGLPAYRGDMVNSAAPTVRDRVADPARMIQAYTNAGATLNLVRAYSRAELADLHGIHELTADWISDIPGARRYDPLIQEVTRSLRLMSAHGIDPRVATAGEIFASHELLVLDYEKSLLRLYDRGGEQRLYDVSTHFLWIGDRTRQLDGAHVELARRLRNPIGIKLGPTATPERIAEYVERLDPNAAPGRISLISRMGHDRVRDMLPPIIEKVSGLGRPVVWLCDPMHGNTFLSSNGFKTRSFDRVVDEVLGFLAVHREAGTHAGGLHLEFTGDNVTECLGGWDDIRESDLPRRHETACDPRLSARQAIELALLAAEGMRW